MAHGDHLSRGEAKVYGDAHAGSLPQGTVEIILKTSSRSIPGSGGATRPDCNARGDGHLSIEPERYAVRDSSLVGFNYAQPLQSQPSIETEHARTGLRDMTVG